MPLTGVLRRSDPGRDHRGNGIYPPVLAACEHAVVVPAGHASRGVLRPCVSLLHCDDAAVGRRLCLGVKNAEPVPWLLRELLADVRLPDLGRLQLCLLYT